MSFLVEAAAALLALSINSFTYFEDKNSEVPLALQSREATMLDSLGRKERRSISSFDLLPEQDVKAKLIAVVVIKVTRRDFFNNFCIFTDHKNLQDVPIWF